ncbi:MAG: hypothetical protein M1829_003824 [Trizodia sp. TS-e1964]|nr:MAG: hypothetical protein M1829_003824 [Trizodia sp. TS-e1964]
MTLDEVPKPTPPSTGAPKPGRFLFKKPAWSKAETTTEEGVEFFSRSKETYTDIVAEQDLKRKRKSARRQRKSLKATEEVIEPAGKKRRLVEDSTDEDETSEEEELKPANNSQTPDASKSLSKAEPSNSSIKLLPNPDKGIPEISTTQAAVNVILLDDDDDEVENSANWPEAHEGLQKGAVKLHPLPIPIEDLSDEEFPELAQKARERAKLKSNDLENANLADSMRTPLAGQVDNVLPPPNNFDPVIQILITSFIANTKPLIVNRKISQRLKDVRITWCERQGFNEETTASVFLTWRGKRVFDVTSCKSLGMSANSQGKVLMLGQEDESLMEGVCQVHMEATTEEILEQSRKLKEKELNMDSTDNNPDEDSIVQPAVDLIKVILKSRGFADHKLIVKANTTFSRITEAFRKTRNPGADKEVWLMFDGERLDPDQTVGESEIGDMDYIDVHVR